MAAAADIMQEIHVETYGSLSKREKVEFILEQMRLNLLRNDFVRTLIISRKINTKYFEHEEVQVAFVLFSHLNLIMKGFETSIL